MTDKLIQKLGQIAQTQKQGNQANTDVSQIEFSDQIPSQNEASIFCGDDQKSFLNNTSKSNLDKSNLDKEDTEICKNPQIIKVYMEPEQVDMFSNDQN